MPARKGLLAPQNTFLDTIATRFDGTHGFCDLTGYSRAQIMQKSCACNFLYGPRTDVQHKEAISRALEQKQELKLEVILYKSTRIPFWCLLDIVPIQDEKHEVVLFLCSHKDITKQKLHEEKEHEFARLLNAQKQQKLADHLNQQQQQQVHLIHPNQLQHPAQQQTQLASAEGNPHQQQPDDGSPANVADQETKLDEANEAELTALANQNALISMDEFELEDSGDENEFDDLDDGEDHDKHTASQYSRRRSRAVLYQLSGHYGCRRSVNMKSKLKLNNRMNIPEYKTTTIEKQRFILSHYGVGKSCWDWLILIVSFYVAIVVPYNATFKDKHQDLSGECKIDSIDIIVEVVFIIDVILNFRTTFVNRKGEVVTRPKIICKHYIRGWFVVDACAAVPFDLLCSSNLYSRSRLDLNLVKLIRLLRLARLLQKMDRYSQYSYIILTLLMLIFSLLAHWCACIWYVIAMEEIERNPPEWKIGWIHQLSDKLGYSVVNTTDMASSYVTALYFTTSSLTSVGFGNVSANTNAEKIFSIVIMLIGALMHAVVFGNVTALIRVMYARRSNYQTRLRDLKDFFRLHQLPKELQQRMSDYFQTTWSLNHGIETYEILKDFPEELRGDVSLHLHREVLSLPIFETAPQGFLKSLARHIESKFCCPTDALNYLYLVCNGSMEVLQDNMVVAILGKGDLVGYDVNAVVTPEHTQYGGLNKAGSMLTGPPMGGLVKSSSDLKALTYCDLKCIHISGLLDVLKLYPEFSDTFHSEIIHDLSFNLRETHDDNQTDEMTDDEEANPLGSPLDDDGYGPEGPRGPGGNGGGGATGNGPRRRSPPPNIGHLYRSITSGDNQIGRYDHDDLDDGAAGEEGDEDEEEEEAEEDEEEEEADDEELEEDEREEPGDEGRGDPGGGSGHNGHDDDRGNGTSGGSTAPNRARQQHGRARGGNGPVEGTATTGECLMNGLAETSSNSTTGNGVIDRTQRDLLEPHNMVSWLHRHHDHERRSFSDDEGTVVESARVTSRAREVAGRGLRRRMIRVQEGDWQSAHSYDALLASSRSRTKRATTVSTNSSVGSLNRNNINDDSKKRGPPEVCRTPAQGSISHPTSSRLRSAIGGRGQGHPGSMGARKPPLSFDLSRNTTAVVDRRRRSAGCIPQSLMMGAMAAASHPARANHSLLNINEEPSMSKESLSGKRANLGSSASRKSTSVARLAKTSAGGSGVGGSMQAAVGANYSNQDLKNIDARITGISASVMEMKHELRMEMSQFRSTVQLLMRLMDKQATGRGTEGSSGKWSHEDSLVRPSSSLHSIIHAKQPLTQQATDLRHDSLNEHRKQRQLSQLSNEIKGPDLATGKAPRLKTSLAKSLSTLGISIAKTPIIGTVSSNHQKQPSIDYSRPPALSAGQTAEATNLAQSKYCQPASLRHGEGGEASDGKVTKEQAEISLSSLSSSSSSLFTIGTAIKSNEASNHKLVAMQRDLLEATNPPPSTKEPQAFRRPKLEDRSPQTPSAQVIQPIKTSTHVIRPAPTTLSSSTDSNPLRPVSQCSSPAKGDLRQSSSGANLNNSDNDSGRSSSSVNSSTNFLGHRNGAGASHEQAQQLTTTNSPQPLTMKQLIVQTGHTMVSGRQPVTHLSSTSQSTPKTSNNTGILGGRPAKMLLTEGDTNQTRRYTIDIEENNEDENKLCCSDNI